MHPEWVSTEKAKYKQSTKEKDAYLCLLRFHSPCHISRCRPLTGSEFYLLPIYIASPPVLFGQGRWCL